MTIEFSISVPQSITDQAQLIEATNAWLSLLHTHEGAGTDKEAGVFLANYTNLTWSNRARFPDSSEVDSWGVKMLPGGGAFYFANFTDGTHVIDHIPNTSPRVPG